MEQMEDCSALKGQMGKVGSRQRGGDGGHCRALMNTTNRYTFARKTFIWAIPNLMPCIISGAKSIPRDEILFLKARKNFLFFIYKAQIHMLSMNRYTV